MNAAILTVGSELLTPGGEDTHSSYLIERLASVGVPVLFKATVGDERRLIAATARQAVELADLVVVTGGLGPTFDDLTREAFADALNLDLTLDEDVLAGIRRRFARRGLEMPEINRRQAMVPQGAEILPNPAGTAPGLWLEWGKEPKRVALLPGPPRELYALVEGHVLPRLRLKGTGRVFRTGRILVAGMAESSVEERIGAIVQATGNPRTSLLASPGQVEIRLTASGQGMEEAASAIESLAVRLRERLGHHIFSERGEPLEGVVGALLARGGQTLAVAESCTGGLITHRLTEIPGSSSYFERGFVTYSDRSKIEMLGVAREALREHGAVSEAVARAMARGARDRAGADLGLAVTGIAGPAGGSADKPIGLVYIALADGPNEEARRHLLPGGRSQIKQWACQLALNQLRLKLLSPS